MAPNEFDPVLLDPTRLSIVSLLAGVEWAEFSWVRESVGLSASALSKQVTTLGNHGYVDVDKGYVGKRPRTWLNLNEMGRRALEAHVAALQRIVDESRQTARAHRPPPDSARRPADRAGAPSGQPDGGRAGQPDG